MCRSPFLGRERLRPGPPAILVLLAIAFAPAGEPAGGAADRIDPAGIGGALVLCGGGALPETVRDEFVKRAGASAARLVIIPTASDPGEEEEDAAQVAAIWRRHGIATITTLHTRRHDEANDEMFVAPLRTATAVWISGGRQSRIAAAYSGTRVERELHALIARGGVVGGTSAGAACLSRVMIVRGRIHETPGLGLLPGAIIDQHFLARRRQARLLSALGAHPDLVGFGIDEGTALVVRGRSLECIGDSTVTICLGETDRSGSTRDVLRPRERSDLTMLRRAAQARVAPRFPPAEPPVPDVPAGALVIVGGGEIPSEIAAQFLALAGGPDALIVVLPATESGRPQEQPREGAFLERAGARNVRVLIERRRDEVESPAFLETLREAKGIWFGGGRQWRFVDAYEGTRAIDAFRDVLRRGGVIGGSSAGASIQAGCLVRGSPLGNDRMLCPGYERGFGFLPGTAIDQHFSERQRFADMSALLAAHPQLLGIGLDESTALIVRGHIATVLGKGQSHFYAAGRPRAAGERDYESLGAGRTYDLRERKPVGDR
jgi:cyanophycinase